MKFQNKITEQNLRTSCCFIRLEGRIYEKSKEKEEQHFTDSNRGNSHRCGFIGADDSFCTGTPEGGMPDQPCTYR